MKTAISIPDNVFRSAEELAHSLNISRSELYVRALRDYLEAHCQEQLTEAINLAIEDIGETALDPTIMRMQINSLPREEW